MFRIFSFLIFISLCFSLHASEDIQVVEDNQTLFFTVDEVSDNTFLLSVEFPNGDEFTSQISFDDDNVYYDEVDNALLAVQKYDGERAIEVSFDDNLGDAFVCKIAPGGNVFVTKVSLIEDLSLATCGSVFMPPQEIVVRNLSIQGKEVHCKAQFAGRRCAITFGDKLYNYPEGEIGQINKTEKIVIQSKRNTSSYIINKGKITAINGFALITANLINSPSGSITTKGFLQIETTNKIVNKGVIHSDDKQSILGVNLINKGTIETLSDIDIRVAKLKNKKLISTFSGGTIEASEEFHNDEGAIISGRDLTCISNNLILNEKGKIDVRSNLSLNVLPGQFRNIGGEVFANNNVSVKAYYFENNRTSPKFTPGESTKGDSHHTVPGGYEMESSPPALLISRHGDINLSFTTGKNEASLIYGGKNAFIQADYFDNRAHHLINDTLRRTTEKTTEYTLGFKKTKWSWVDKIEPNPKYKAAAIIAGESLEFIIGGQRTSVNNMSFDTYLDPNKFINSGHVQAQEKISIKSNESDEYAEFLNGLSDSWQKTGSSMLPDSLTFHITPTVPYAELGNALGYDEPNSHFYDLNHPKYKYAGHFAGGYDFERELFNQIISTFFWQEAHDYMQIHNIVAYTPKGAELVTKNPGARFLMSSDLEERVLANSLFSLFNTPFLKDYSDPTQQLCALRIKGVRQSLINGHTKLVNAAKNASCNNIEVDEDSIPIIAQNIEDICKDNCPSVEEVAKRWCQISSGSHITILPEDKLYNANESMIVTTETPCGEELCLSNVIHVVKADITDVHPEGSVVSKNGSIKISTPVVKNTGFINGKEITIRAYNFLNERRTSIHEEQVWQNGGLFTSGYMRTYEVHTLQPGGVISGAIITIETTDEFTNTGQHKGGIINRGGTIAAELKVYALSQNGNILNTAQIGSHVLEWNAGWLGDLFGKSSSTLVKDLYPGQIISGGEIDLISETEHVIIEATKIFAKKDVNIKGYLGVVLKGLHAKWTNSSKAKLSGLKVKTKKTEKIEYERTVIESEGSINIDSSEGTVEIKGVSLRANMDVVINGVKTDIGPYKVTEYSSSSETGFDTFSFSHSEGRSSQDHVFQTEILAGNAIKINSLLDNYLESVVLVSGELIHIVAGRHNVFTGTEKKRTVSTNGFSIGVSFLGSEAINAAVHGEDLSTVATKLASEDPLAAALLRLKDAKDGADIGGEGVHVGLNALKTLADLDRLKRLGGSDYKGYLGERLGTHRRIVHNPETREYHYEFDPEITFRIGFFDSNSEYVEIIPTTATSKVINIESGETTYLDKGSRLIAEDEINMDVGGLETSPGYKGQTSSSSSAGVSATIGAKSGSLFAFGVDGATSSSDGKTFFNAIIMAPNINANIRGDLVGHGVNIEGERTNITVHGDVYLESVQDYFDAESMAGSVNVGVCPAVSVSGSYSEQDISYAHTLISTIRGTNHLRLLIDGKLYGVGALIDGGPGSVLEVEGIEVTNLNDHDTSDSTQISGSSSGHGILDINVENHEKLGITKFTIGIDVDVRARDGKGANGAHRNPDTMQQTTSESHTHFRVVIPTNWSQVGEDFKDASNFLRRENLTMQDVDTGIADIDEIKATLPRLPEENDSTSYTIADLDGESITKKTFVLEDDDGDGIITVNILATKNENSTWLEEEDNFNELLNSMHLNNVQILEDAANPNKKAIVFDTNGERTIIKVETSGDEFKLSKNKLIKNIIDIASEFFVEQTIADLYRNEEYFSMSPEEFEKVQSEIREETPQLVENFVNEMPAAIQGAIHGTGDFVIKALVGMPQFLAKWALSEIAPKGFNPATDMLYENNDLAADISTNFLIDQMETILPFDQSSETYLSFRSGTETTLFVASCVAGAYGVGRATAVSFSKFQRFRKINSLTKKTAKFVPEKILTRNAQTLEFTTLEIADIDGWTTHAVERAIERGIKPENVINALKKPLKVESIRIDSLGRPSQRFIGKNTEVVINPNTKKIVSVNPTSTKKVKKLLKDLKNNVKN